ncbi:MAG: MATE family efflux transporter [Peptococcaceae bacterium]|jgi:putative MATE family efflux protein|nr:MATE family efflux transporter [Peptococcaceae bacterium]
MTAGDEQAEQKIANIDAAGRLGVEPVGRLLWRFSLPAIIGMLVNAFYNVIDRIFVGRGVDELALGGVALVMPLMTITMAFAMLFGTGAANLISIRLGEQRREEAANTLTHCFLLMIVIGLVLTVAGLIFLDPLMSLMGAEQGSKSLEYGRDFMRIILLGQVFGLIGFGMSHCTRAQGFPKITMIAMLMSAVVNIFLDILFIFGLHWGVQGAALATILAQLLSGLWILSFNFSKKAVIRINLRDFRPSRQIITQILSFGSAQFLIQLAIAAVMLVYNFCMTRYGAASLGVADGGDIALSGISIVNTIAMIFLMPIFGINQGSQPILGYNYGARKFDRVLKTYRLAVTLATVVACAGFAVAMIWPLGLTRLFAPDGSAALLAFTPWAMRVYVLLLPVVGYQVVSANLFVVTGRPKVSIVLSMLRQVFVLIPCLLLFGWWGGVYGSVFAAPLSDAVATLTTTVVVWFEIKKLRVGAREAHTGTIS